MLNGSPYPGPRISENERYVRQICLPSRCIEISSILHQNWRLQTGILDTAIVQRKPEGEGSFLSILKAGGRLGRCKCRSKARCAFFFSMYSLHVLGGVRSHYLHINGRRSRIGIKRSGKSLNFGFEISAGPIC